MIEPFIPPVIDQEEAYDEKVSPLVKQIIEACKEAGIPCFMSFCFQRNEDGELGLATTHIPANYKDCPTDKGADFIDEYTQCLAVVKRNKSLVAFTIKG